MLASGCTWQRGSPTRPSRWPSTTTQSTRSDPRGGRLMAIRTEALATDFPVVAELPPTADVAQGARPANRGLRALARAASGTFALNVFNTVATFAITALLA